MLCMMSCELGLLAASALLQVRAQRAQACMPASGCQSLRAPAQAHLGEEAGVCLAEQHPEGGRLLLLLLRPLCRARQLGASTRPALRACAHLPSAPPQQAPAAAQRLREAPCMACRPWPPLSWRCAEPFARPRAPVPPCPAGPPLLRWGSLTPGCQRPAAPCPLRSAAQQSLQQTDAQCPPSWAVHDGTHRPGQGCGWRC